MAVKIGNKGGEGYTPIEKDTYPGVINYVVLIGTHDHTYNGETKERTQVIVGFELPTVQKQDKDGNPYNATVKQFYTASTDDRSKLYPVITSALRRDLGPEEAKDFDLGSLVGKVVAVTIDHKKKGNGDVTDYVKTVGQVMKGTPNYALSNPPVTFGFETKPNGELDIPEGITEGIKRLIFESKEYQCMVSEGFEAIPPKKAETPPKTAVDEIPMDFPKDEDGTEDEPEAPAETEEERIAALEASLPADMKPEIRAELIKRMRKLG